MPNVFETVENIGYGRRVAASFGRALFGLLLFVAAFPLEFWNEGRAVDESRALSEGAGSVVVVAASPRDAAQEGKLVHLSGLATATQPLNDPDFGVSSAGLALLREVEMFQWKEKKETKHEKKLGGGERKVTTYRYDMVWDDERIDSSDFQEREGHLNPDKMPFSSARYDANPVHVGDYTLDTVLVSKIRGEQAVLPKMEELPPNLAATFQLDDGRLVTSRDAGKPEIGDIRIGFTAVPQQVVSAIGLLRNGAIETYTTSNGRPIALLDSGNVSAAQMFAAAQSRASTLTWIFRGVGLAAMWLGLTMALGWVSRVLDVLPFLGTLVEKGVALVAALIALCLSALTIAIAWFFYRPLIATALIAVAVGAVWLLRQRARKARTPPPPPGGVSSLPPPAPR
ncbi:MAG: TMEM43 family protein [Tahibacter sp.]